jgi:hypothetical protein
MSDVNETKSSARGRHFDPNLETPEEFKARRLAALHAYHGDRNVRDFLDSRTAMLSALTASMLAEGFEAFETMPSEYQSNLLWLVDSLVDEIRGATVLL